MLSLSYDLPYFYTCHCGTDHSQLCLSSNCPPEHDMRSPAWFQKRYIAYLFATLLGKICYLADRNTQVYQINQVGYQ